MPRISKHELDIKKECFLDAFESLKEESYKKGRNLADIKAIVELANQDERMLDFKDKIGDKTPYNKGKGSMWPPLVEMIKEWTSEFKNELGLANNRAKDQLEEVRKKLISNESLNIELQKEVHSLRQRLQNKERIIKQVEKERDNYAKELNKLPKEFNVQIGVSRDK